MNSSEKGNELSVYSREIPTAEVLGGEIKKLQAAFPRQSNGFFSLLAERLIANKFSDDRLRDAVGAVVDKFCYKEINISDVVSFDKRVKLYTYEEVCDLIPNRAQFSDFQNRDVGGRKFWVKVADL